MRKLSDGILPCGRCGGRPQKYWDAYWEYFRGMSLRCRDCGLAALKGYTEENAESLWNTLSAATHPEPEDYYELLRECDENTPLLKRLYDTGDDSDTLLRELQDDYGDDDD